MRVHLYQHSPTAWDWRTAATVSQRHHAEMARRLARWGHTAESFSGPGEAQIGPQGVPWHPASAINPAVPDVLLIYGTADPFPAVRNGPQVRSLLAPTHVPDDAAFGRQLANLNAVLYDQVGGSVVADHRGHLYRHPNHFIYAHPWEAAVRAEYLRLGPGDVMLDVGSSIGSWSLPAAASGATVYAFDPGTDAGMLRRLAAENGLSARLKVDGRLVAEASGRPVKRADIPWHSVPPEGTFGDTVTVSIDDFVAAAGLGRVDFVKVDTDGGEREVIAGMAGTLQRFRPRVIVETHTFLGVSVEEVTGLLGGLGYSTKAIGLEEDYYYHVYGVPA